MKYLFFLIVVSFLFSCNDYHFPVGGTPYKIPHNFEDSNNYYLPYKDNLLDSEAIANSTAFLKAFKERNISLKGENIPIVRLVFEGQGMSPLVITITEKKVVSKIGMRGNIFPQGDILQLSQIERLHFKILRWNLKYPVYGVSKKEIQFFDSLTKINPRLASKEYYDELNQKTLIKNDEPFEFKSDTIFIDRKRFKNVIDTINKSGFWRMKTFSDLTTPTPADGGGYYLEINSKYQYHIVQKSLGSNDSSSLFQLFNYILNLANLDQKHSNWQK